MWIITKNGDYVNLDHISLIRYEDTNKKWFVCETGAEGFSREINNDTHDRILDYISKNIL
jgi:hypothetical protein